MISTPCHLITLPQKNNLPSSISHNPLPANNLEKHRGWGVGYLVIIGGGGVKKRQGVKKGRERGWVKERSYYNVYIIIY